MFKRRNDSEIDIASLNQILRTGKRLINIGFFMAIVCLVLLGTYLIKEWKILTTIGEIIHVVSPIFIGLLIAWLFEPLVTKLEKKKIPRLVGCILVYVLLIGMLFGISYLFLPSLLGQVKDFIGAAPSIFDDLTNFALKLVETVDPNGLVNINDLKHEITDVISKFGMSIISDIPKYIVAVSKGVISGGLNFVLGLMIGFYLLFDIHKVNKAITRIIPKEWVEPYNDLTNRINTSLRSYVQGVLIIMLIVFITQTIGLTLAGLEAPIVFALFCALTDIIPYFGPYIGGIPAVIVGFTISPITGICVLIAIIIVQLLENNFYQPLIMGHTMKLHPVTIMVGLLIFQHFFGILGMVIATPVIACLKVLTEFINEKLQIFNFEKEKDEEDKNEQKLLKLKSLFK
ncbi:MAG: AI-2E family transporter [Bacilli bacterium]|nr:AI-2E family transporter [Bacilli bacterium]